MRGRRVSDSVPTGLDRLDAPEMHEIRAKEGRRPRGWHTRGDRRAGLGGAVGAAGLRLLQQRRASTPSCARGEIMRLFQSRPTDPQPLNVGAQRSPNASVVDMPAPEGTGSRAPGPLVLLQSATTCQREPR